MYSEGLRCQLADDGFAVVEEEFVASVTVRFLVGLLMDAGFVEGIDLGSGYGQQDGGVGDDDVLGSFSRHLHDSGKQRQLPVGRKRGFRFVHQIPIMCHRFQVVVERLQPQCVFHAVCSRGSLPITVESTLAGDPESLCDSVVGESLQAIGFRGALKHLWNGQFPSCKFAILGQFHHLAAILPCDEKGVGDIRSVNEYFILGNPDRKDDITDKTMINTVFDPNNPSKDYKHEFKTYKYDLKKGWSGNSIEEIANSIYVRVIKSNKLVTLTAEKGRTASKIAVGTDYDWCNERQDIDTKFSGRFSEYVGGAHSWNTWYK